MLRKFISKLNISVSKNVVAPRRSYEVPIKLSFVPESISGRLKTPVNDLSITGETIDLSKTGIALIVPAIRLQENYLVGEDRVLNAELTLPNGIIKMQVVGQRYQQVGKHISVSRYLIGARILSMTEDNREAYETFLRYGNKETNGAGVLQLGVDES